MNKVMLIGRLTAKPELRYTSSNLPYARFSIAVNRTFSNSQGERETDFINVVVWRKQAENVANYLDQGSLVGVEGRLQSGNYTDKDGNKRYTLDVQADNVQFLETRSQSQARQSSSNNYSNEPAFDMPSNDIDLESDPYAEYGDSVSIDDNFLD
ncbi:MAG: single-stranded DNA-binding protein [Bacilli bacterium]|nr:single-stranded DNA-binding protein [Bacilli bacterium]